MLLELICEISQHLFGFHKEPLQVEMSVQIWNILGIRSALKINILSNGDTPIRECFTQTVGNYTIFLI